MSEYDISFAIEAKSDQLNAVDIMGAEPVITIRAVKVVKGEHPVSIYYDGDNNKPWKPSKGMLRILAGGWGTDSSKWVGRSVRLFFEPTVLWAGKEVGGIQIKAMTDIPADGIRLFLTLNKKQRVPFLVEFLKIEAKAYPADRFEKALPVMAEKLKAGEMTLPQIVAQCQKTGQLTEQQLAQLEAAVPLEVNDHNEDEEEQY